MYKTRGEVPDEEYLIPFGKAEIKKIGQDMTVVATSRMVNRALEASHELKKENIDLEIIDLRTIVPLDLDTIINSVKKTGCLIVIEEENKTGGVGAEITALTQEKAFKYLKKPIKRISSFDVPIPFNDKLKNYVIPNKQRIVNEIKNYIKEE